MWKLMRAYPVVLGPMLLLTTAAVSYCQTDGEKVGTLTVSVTDNRGGKLQPGKLTIRSSQGAMAYTAETDYAATVRLPYGKYTVTFETQLFKPARRDVVVDRPESFVALAANFVPLERGPDDFFSVSLGVTPSASCLPDGFLWAKLVGVFSDYVAERRFLPAGFALFEPVEFGTYLVIVIDGRNVRATKVIETNRSITTVKLKLSPCAEDPDH